jgi:aspartyl-tRNA(Asn)/glutamyl-tRNA(Gln) amidotransferase subunit A
MTDTTIESLRAGVASGETAAREVVRASVEAAERLNGELNAFLEIDRDGAVTRAAEVDERGADRKSADQGSSERNSVESRGALAGVPVAIKDNICVRGLQTSCGSHILGAYHPPYTATAVERLIASGAVVVGKTNCDEFAMGSSTENSAFGAARNPWDTGRVPGGSSGGSAASVAARVVPVALGSETGGSVRQPAALCGVVGVKPTYGRVSRYGLVAFGSSLDQIGTITLSARDAATVLAVMAGRDERDATTADVPVPAYASHLTGEARGARIGVPRSLFGEGLDAGVRASVERAIEVFRDLGAEIVDVELPHAKYAIAVYYIIATAEASSNLARYDGVRYGFRAEESPELRSMYRRTREEGFGAEVKRRVMLGTYVLSSGYYDAYYLKAQRVRSLIKQDFADALADCDAILTPTTPTTAFRLGEKANDPLAMYLNDIYTVPANLAGVPAVSLPCGLSHEGLPVGMQLVARHWDEATMLRLADAYERAAPFTARPRVCAVAAD